MMSNRGQKDSNNFIMQAGILAAAGFISRIIGLLYRSPLYGVIGDLGMGYYQAAYGFYTIVLLISSYTIPAAMSKVIAQKLALKEYNNAHRFFKGALLYVLIVGGIASLFLFFGAGIFVEPQAIPVLRTFAPTIFAYGILGVLRGYFQAHKSMVQTSVSQIFEQIANAIVSIGAAYLLIQLFMGTMEEQVLEADRVARATYGAIGSAIGTGVGVLIGLLFMVGMYALNRKLIKRRIARDHHQKVDSYKEIFKTITMVVTPFILSTAIYNLSAPVNSALYTKILPGMLSRNAVDSYEKFGIFSGQALTIANIPIALATAMAAAMLPTVSQLIAAKDIEGAREKIGVSVKTTMILSIPCAVGLGVLARPIVYLLFPGKTEVIDIAGRLLMTLAPSVVFFALSTLNNNVLQSIGKLNAPIMNAGIALILQTVVALGLLLYTDLDLYSLAIVNTLYAGMICILNQNSVRRAIGYRQEVLRTFITPLIAATIMGAVAWAVYEAMYLITDSMRISLIPAIPLAAVVYFAMLLLLRGVSEEELRGFPKGYLLVKIAKKCRLL